MKRAFFRTTTLALAVFLISATQKATGQIDLTEKGIPVTVQAPAGAVVEEGLGNGVSMGESVLHVWEINKDNFSLEVSMDDDELWQSLDEYMEDAIELAKSDGFDGFVLEEENGFIYRVNYDGEISYDFYYRLIKNNHNIEFSTGLGSMDWSLENVKKVYAAAKGAK